MRRLALIAAAGIVLAGCGSSHTTTQAESAAPAPHSHHPVLIHTPVVTSGLPRAGDHMNSIVRLIAPNRLAIATSGSSSCPSVPDELVMQTRHQIRIHLVTGSWSRRGPVAALPANGICTTNLGMARMVVAIDPERVDVHEPLRVKFFYRQSKKPQVWTAEPLGG